MASQPPPGITQRIPLSFIIGYVKLAKKKRKGIALSLSYTPVTTTLLNSKSFSGVPLLKGFHHTGTNPFLFIISHVKIAKKKIMKLVGFDSPTMSCARLYLIYFLDPFPDRGVRLQLVSQNALHAQPCHKGLGCWVFSSSL